MLNNTKYTAFCCQKNIRTCKQLSWILFGFIMMNTGLVMMELIFTGAIAPYHLPYISLVFVLVMIIICLCLVMKLHNAFNEISILKTEIYITEADQEKLENNYTKEQIKIFEGIEENMGLIHNKTQINIVDTVSLHDYDFIKEEPLPGEHNATYSVVESPILATKAKHGNLQSTSLGNSIKKQNKTNITVNRANGINSVKSHLNYKENNDLGVNLNKVASDLKTKAKNTPKGHIINSNWKDDEDYDYIKN